MDSCLRASTTLRTCRVQIALSATCTVSRKVEIAVSAIPPSIQFPSDAGNVAPLNSMRKSKDYRLTRFTADAIREARDVLHRQVPTDMDRQNVTMSAVVDDASWHYDSEEGHVSARVLGRWISDCEGSLVAFCGRRRVRQDRLCHVAEAPAALHDPRHEYRTSDGSFRTLE